MDTETEKDLRSEWQYRVQRLDSLHDEAWSIQTVQHERMTEIWLEVARHRARIGEIAATGVSFDAVDPPQRRADESAYWVQPTTGMVHRSQACSVARRSRYGLQKLEDYHVTQKWCKRCFPNGRPE